MAAVACLGAGAARADHGDAALKETIAGAAVDWQAGTIAASAGAAADLRMPSVDLARPGAQRRAQAGAVAKLRAALGNLPLGSGQKLSSAEIERAVGRARTVDVQYQSNGGAIVRAEVRFGDWLEKPDPKVGFALAVPSIRPGAAPMVRIGKRDVRVGAAIFQITAAKVDKNVAEARVDKEGRILLSGDAQLGDRLAQSLVIVHVAKVQR